MRKNFYAYIQENMIVIIVTRIKRSEPQIFWLGLTNILLGLTNILVGVDKYFVWVSKYFGWVDTYYICTAFVNSTMQFIYKY